MINKKLNHGCSILLILLLVCMLFIQVSGAESLIVTIPVVVKDDGTLPPETETHEIRLGRRDVGSPMPDGSQDGSFALTIAGSGKDSIAMSFDSPGEYHYSIRQIKGKDTKCTYDTTVYDLKVTIVYDDQGSLEASVVMYPEGKTEKQSEASFANQYNYDDGPKENNPTDGGGSTAETPNDSDSDSRTPTGGSSGGGSSGGGSSSGGSSSTGSTSRSGTTTYSSTKTDPLKTGDTNPINTWTLVLIGSLLMVVLLSRGRRRDAA